MAARYDHGASIARADVSKRQKYVHLATAELIVDETVLIAHHSILVPRMDREEAPCPADGGKAFVDIQTFHVAALFTAISQQAILPGGMVNQLLEWLAALNNILQFHPGIRIVIQALD